MAIKNAVTISVDSVTDGISSSFSIDLTKDPYFLGGNVVNWFSDNRRVTQPTGVSSADPNVSVSLSGTVLTINYTIAPVAGVNSTTVFVEF